MEALVTCILGKLSSSIWRHPQVFFKTTTGNSSNFKRTSQCSNCQQPHLRLCNFQHCHLQAQNLQLQVDRHGVWLWPMASTDRVCWKSWHSKDSWIGMWRNCICQIGCGKVNSNLFLDALVLEPWWCMKCRTRQPLRWLFYYLQGFIHPMLEYRMLDHGKCREASWKNGLIRSVSFVSCCESR